MHIRSFLSFLLIFSLFGCKTSQSFSGTNDANSVEEFLSNYTQTYLKLYTASSEAEWKANTKIIPNDNSNAKLVQQTGETFAAFTGSKEVIEQTKKFLAQKDGLTPLQIRQLEAILYRAANNPETVENTVKKRIAAENTQNETLFGYDFMVDGKSIDTGIIDSILTESNDLQERLAYWESSKEVGKELKDGLEELRNLRNQTVRALGYNDYYAYQVSDYGMTTEEMQTLLHQLIKEIWPLYRELHTWARYELAKKYNQPVPEMIPAHWLPNRWGQDWLAMVDVEGLDLNKAFEDKTAEWVVTEGENFYKSLGFPALPSSFYKKSSMYPLSLDANYKKNNHASAWHMDLDQDVRCLMSVKPTPDYYETVHHELGHIYYYLTYTNSDVPPLLRKGANRAFHEGVGSLMGLAAMQKPFLQNRGLVDANAEVDETQLLLKEALNYIVFMPWAAGVMSDFEQTLYEGNLSKDSFNKEWWSLKKKYQGIIPPALRGEEYNDAASKTHINNDAAQYYDYALSYVILFQLHDHISKNILHQDPHATNYYGSKEVGGFLQKILYPGASADWRELMKKELGSEISAKPMLDYFEPLMDYLKKENQGRTYTLSKNFNSK